MTAQKGRVDGAGRSAAVGRHRAVRLRQLAGHWQAHRDQDGGRSVNVQVEILCYFL